MSFFLCCHIVLTLQCEPYVCVFHVLFPYEASSVQQFDTERTLSESHIVHVLSRV